MLMVWTSPDSQRTCFLSHTCNASLSVGVEPVELYTQTLEKWADTGASMLCEDEGRIRLQLYQTPRNATNAVGTKHPSIRLESGQ
jgi:hypothetical protein